MVTSGIKIGSKIPYRKPRAADSITRGLRVLRWHTVNPRLPQSVGEHSAGVGLILVRLFNGAPPGRLLQAALVHDIGECVLGDIPAPTKKALTDEARDGAHQLERDAVHWLGFDDAEHLCSEPFEARMLKFADVLEGCCHVTAAILSGDRSPALIEAARNYVDYARAVHVEITAQWGDRRYNDPFAREIYIDLQRLIEKETEND